MAIVRVNNILLDTEKVSHVVQDPKNVNKVTVYMDNELYIVFEGSEAMEAWRLFDPDKGWRNEDEK